MFSKIKILPPEWEIGLSSWIIQDGNYGDFESGQMAEFAVEFYPHTFQPSESKIKSVKFIGDAKYEICAEIVYLTKDVWVLDFGICAFEESKPSARLKIGDYVTATIYLGIDPFFYFEYLHRLAGMPPLIYSWKINSISRQTAPFIESYEDTGRKVLIRDPNKRGHAIINQTDAWNDDGGNAEYVLNCTRMDTAPKSRCTKILKI